MDAAREFLDDVYRYFAKRHRPPVHIDREWKRADDERWKAARESLLDAVLASGEKLLASLSGDAAHRLQLLLLKADRLEERCYDPPPDDTWRTWDAVEADVRLFMRTNDLVWTDLQVVERLESSGGWSSKHTFDNHKTKMKKQGRELPDRAMPLSFWRQWLPESQAILLPSEVSSLGK